MSKERIEDIMSDKLGTYASTIDTGDVWNAIESQVPQKKRRKRYFILFFMGIIGVGAFLTQMLKVNFSNENTHSNINSTNHSIVVNKKERTLIDKKVWKGTESINIEGNSTINEERPSYSAIGTSVTINSGGQQSEGLAIEIKLDGSAQKQLDIQTEPDYEKLKIAPITAANRLESIPLSFISERLLLSLPRVKRPKKDKGLNHFVTLTYNIGSLWDINADDNSQNQLDYGQGLLDQSVNISYGHILGHGFYIKGGVGYAHNTFKFRENVESVSFGPATLDRIIRTNKYIDGAQENISGEPEVEISETRQILNYNTVRAFTLDVGLGYQKQLSNRLSIEVYASLSNTRVIAVNGVGKSIGDSEFIPLTKDVLRPSFFRCNIGGQIVTSAIKGIDLVAGVSAAQDLNYRTRDSYGNMDVFRSLYGHVGVRKQF